MSLRKLAGFCGALLIAGCNTVLLPLPPPTMPLGCPCPSAVPSTLLVPDAALADLGAIVGDAACATGPRRYLLDGFKDYAHVAFWVEATTPNPLWIPGPYQDGRVFGAVLFGEGDVLEGKVLVERSSGGLGLTEDGGRMVLDPGKIYTWVVVADGVVRSFLTFALPTRPCYSPVPSPGLAVSHAQPCDGVLVITGDGFIPGPVHLQALLPHQLQPGEIDTGKGPPETHDLGETQADAGGHLAFEAKPDFLAHRAWTLRVYDAGRTRLSTLEVPACP